MIEGLCPASSAHVERFILAVALNALLARFESFSKEKDERGDQLGVN